MNDQGSDRRRSDLESSKAIGASTSARNPAFTITLRDLYKEHQWQVAGPTFYQLHLLFDKHSEQQNELVDKIAERIQLLGGVSIAMAPDDADSSTARRT